MTNPVGTKEQREELLDLLAGRLNRHGALLAFAGLDIAQALRDLLNECRSDDGSVELRRNLWKNAWDKWQEGD